MQNLRPGYHLRLRRSVAPVHDYTHGRRDPIDGVGHGRVFLAADVGEEQLRRDALLGGDGAVLVLHEDLAELQDLLAQRGDLLVQDIVLLAVEISLGLQILQPLLLPLATFEGGDAMDVSLDPPWANIRTGCARESSFSFPRRSSSDRPWPCLRRLMGAGLICRGRHRPFVS